MTVWRLRTGIAMLAAGLACALGAASAAHANSDLRSFIMDDDLLIYGSYADRASSLASMNKAGVDGIRVTVSWKFISGEQNGKPRRVPARQRGRKAENPRNYRRDIWDRFDDIVRLAKANDIQVLFNITGPGPVWAMGHAPHARRFDQPAWKPNAAAFARFVKAVGTRYSGTYKDENQDHSVLPRVDFWSVWNEVNQPASLSPQMEFNRRLHKQIPVAPILYRNLYWAATSALKQTGHGGDFIMMGETAPLGGIRNTPRVHLWPKLFLREMFCLKPNGRPFTGAEASARQCSALKKHGPFLVKGYAHHPYTQKDPPTKRDRNRDSINIANIGDLPPFLDWISDHTGGLLPKGLPVALTEIGWETKPPDPTRGVSAKHQADWLNEADHIAFDQPRVFLNTQFVLRDVKPVRKYRGQRKHLSQYWATWQSGLLYANGKPKPAFTAYLLPFDIRRNGANLDLWGQLKFFPNGVPGDVYLQFRQAGSKNWQSIGAPIHVDNQMGFWGTSVPKGGPGVWRAVVQVYNSYFTSREISVSG